MSAQSAASRTSGGSNAKYSHEDKRGHWSTLCNQGQWSTVGPSQAIADTLSPAHLECNNNKCIATETQKASVKSPDTGGVRRLPDLTWLQRRHLKPDAVVELTCRETSFEL
ncbi:hypothetical protein EYF80_042953 [Liparis tanakae]|uniref:Uncharacterized protein n=1 Tax=Liparis tanakae TaxID=230148 RepID=A0A4Z2G1X8_9TELE|nr:hypothetical protein EYF80_042953 [Liparis tanakae]